MSRKDETVESLLAKENWHEERKALRAIMTDTGLTEEVKWGLLCYTLDGSTVANIYCMKDTFGIAFFKGTLMADPEGILVSPGKNSQAAMRIECRTHDDIARLEPVIRAYVAEAIRVDEAGLKVDFKEKRELVYPDELQDAIDGDPEFAEAFAALTPGRQRGYVLFIDGAKQPATRAGRVEKHRNRILQGKGIHDR